MLQPIRFQNFVVTHLYENEIDALTSLAPYWGLVFDDKTLTICPALENRSVCIEHVDKHIERDSLQSILHHTKLTFVSDCENADLSISVHFVQDDHSAPISLQINGNKYHLKFMNHFDHTNIQTLIHRNIWLPKREKRLFVYVQDRQPDVIAYLIIQFFLKEKMTSLSHIPFPIYEKLITQVLTPINPNFAYLQKNVCLSVWPDIPSRFFKQKEAQAEKIDPFKKKITAYHNPIDPFKKKTQNPNKRI